MIAGVKHEIRRSVEFHYFNQNIVHRLYNLYQQFLILWSVRSTIFILYEENLALMIQMQLLRIISQSSSYNSSVLYVSMHIED